MAEQEFREEWAVRHSQGVATGYLPWSEAVARQRAEEMAAQDVHRQPRARGKVRVVRRLYTDWEEVE